MYAAEINIQYSILVKFQFDINFNFCKKKLGKLHVCLWKTLVEYIKYLYTYLLIMSHFFSMSTHVFLLSLISWAIAILITLLQQIGRTAYHKLKKD